MDSPIISVTIEVVAPNIDDYSISYGLAPIRFNVGIFLFLLKDSLRLLFNKSFFKSSYSWFPIVEFFPKLNAAPDNSILLFLLIYSFIIISVIPKSF